MEANTQSQHNALKNSLTFYKVELLKRFCRTPFAHYDNDHPRPELRADERKYLDGSLL